MLTICRYYFVIVCSILCISFLNAQSPLLYNPHQSIPLSTLPIIQRDIMPPMYIRHFYDDRHLWRFVNRDVPLQDTSYRPKNMVSIKSPLINEAGRRSIIRRDARDALWKMAWAFVQKFWKPLVVISGYRSAAYQQRIWDRGTCTVLYCAIPWHSEHQLWLAVDFFDASSAKEFETNPTYRANVAWLQSNAHHYGYTQSYQKWPDIDQYNIEPWHWRYVGVDMATRLYELKWTYTQWYRFQENLQRL